MEMTDEQEVQTQEDIAQEFKSEVGITTLNLNKQPRRLGEVLDEIAPEGEKVKVADIVGWPIVIRAARLFKGQYGVGAFVIFTDENGALYNTIIGQTILLSKLMTALEYLPVECTILRLEGGQFGEYYDFE
jgi:hypothetical protein